jgi:hypothetical protein
MNRDDDQQLWDLLGRAKQLQPSPFFARNVLREIRQEPRWKATLRSWLAPRRLAPAAGLAVAVIAGIILTHQPAGLEQPETAAAPADSDPIARIDPQDYEVVADLDDLLASEENNLWDDDTSSL